MKKMLVRDFIFDRMCHRQGSYYSKATQVGQSQKPLNFKQMIGKSDYHIELGKIYPQYGWLTPSQIFYPYYGYSIGNCIAQNYLPSNKNSQLKIIQIGPGKGALAQSILNFFHLHYPTIYNSMSYKCIDVSKYLLDATKSRLLKNHNKFLLRNGLKQQHCDFKQFCLKPLDGQSVIIMCQVLDNLPHDKLVKQKNQWMQTLVNTQLNTNIAIDQKFQPIQDPTIKKLFDIWQNLQDKTPIQQSTLFLSFLFWFGRIRFKPVKDKLFLPTYFYSALQALAFHSANYANFIIADFDQLISNQNLRQGINAPLVKIKGQKPYQQQILENYLINRGQADILFPSNFKLLEAIHQNIFKRQAKIQKSRTFLNQFKVSAKQCQTKNGYNPLLQEFPNTAILCSQPKQ